MLDELDDELGNIVDFASLVKSSRPGPKPTGRKEPEKEFWEDASGIWAKVDCGKAGYEHTRLGSRIEIAARTRCVEGKSWGRLLRIWNAQGQVNEWAMPMEMLASKQGEEVRKKLAYYGFEQAVSQRFEIPKLLLLYLQYADPKESIICQPKIGWAQDGVFVLPDMSFGEPEGLRYVYQNAGTQLASHGQKGTLAGWQAAIGRYCVGNSRLAFSVCVALASTMLTPAKLEGGGFHFRGESSNGKTTTLWVAGSVMGGEAGKKFTRNWRSTDNALESLAAQHNDFLLGLDEIGQVLPKAAGAAGYMLANGQGKSRMAASAEGKAGYSWNLYFLSTGEISLGDKMSEDGKERAVMAGQEIRMIDLPAVPRCGFGIYETLHEFAHGAALSDHLQSWTGEEYGTVVRDWLSKSAGPGVALAAGRLRLEAEGLAGSWTPEGAAGQIYRVALRFAFSAAVGEAAIAAGSLDWPAGQARWAAERCFEDWLEARGTLGSLETGNGLRKVQSYLLKHMKERFPEWVGGDSKIASLAEANDAQTKTFNLAGYKRKEQGRWFFYVLKDVFQKEMCIGHDAKTVAKTLEEKGLLVMNNGLQFKARLPCAGGSVVNCYKIDGKVLEEDC